MDIKKILNMDNKTYDRLKWLVLVVEPALVVLLIGLAKLYDAPVLSTAAATIGLVSEFVGSCLLISSRNYNKEAVVEVDHESKKVPEDL